jgi:PKD repeat protein/glucose/arabinose dehydrogenase
MLRLLRQLLLSILVFHLSAVGIRADQVAPRDSFPTGFVSDRILDLGPHYPTAAAFGPEGRIFVTFKHGAVLLYRDGPAPITFLDISEEVNQFGDRGLLGLALHPLFPAQPYVYLVHVYDPPELPGERYADDGPDGAGARVSRLIRVEADPDHDYDVAREGSAVVLLGRNSTFENIGDPTSQYGPPSCDTGAGSPDTPGTPMEDCIPADGSSHSIGTVIFGNDGTLFVGNGDSSRWMDVDPRALRTLDLDSLVGKVLRIDPMTGEGLPDNPFFLGDPARNRSRVWSYGFRNPFRFAIHPETNEPLIGDAGWESWEELNSGRGGNFGWPCYEGDDQGNLRQPAFEHHEKTAAACAELYALEPDEVTAPLYAYPRDGRNTAIIAGDFYTGTIYPEEFRGALFLADHNRQEMNVARIEDGRPVEVTPFGEGTGGIVQILRGPDTNLHYVILGERNELRRLRWSGSGNQPPRAQASAIPMDGEPPLRVEFSSDGSYDPDGDEITFFWDFGDGATATDPHPSHLYTKSGVYRATLTVSDPAGLTGSDSIRLIVGNTAPEAVIHRPLDGSTYTIDEEIAFEGSGFDHQDGELEGESLIWELVLHHADHIHPNVFAAEGAAGSFVVEDHGDDTRLELKLTATDSSGLGSTVSVTIDPQTVERHFTTDPPGLSLVYQGSLLEAPFTVTPVIGGWREIHAPPVQQHRSFESWSDGGERSRSIAITDEPVSTLSARYVNHPPVARVTAEPTRGEFPLRVELSGAGSSDAEDDELAYEWDFGDGSVPVAGRDVVHVFEEEGLYRVVLTVRDALGAEAEAVVWIGEPGRGRAVRRR